MRSAWPPCGGELQGPNEQDQAGLKSPLYQLFSGSWEVCQTFLVKRKEKNYYWKKLIFIAWVQAQ